MTDRQTDRQVGSRQTGSYWLLVLKGSTSVSAYFPSGKWYDWYTHEVTSATTTGETKQLDTPVDHIQVLTQPERESLLLPLPHFSPHLPTRCTFMVVR